MKLIRLFIMVIFIALLANIVSSQDTLVVDMNRNSYEVPIKKPVGSMILSTWVAQDTGITTFKNDGSVIEVQRYLVDLKKMIYLPQFHKDSFVQYTAIVFKKENDKQLYFSIDVNKNKKVLDNKFVPIEEGKPFYFQIPLKKSSLDISSLSVPFQFEFSTNGNLFATSLLKYDIQVNLGNTSLSMELNLGVYYPHFAFQTFSENSGKLIPQNYLLDEPFNFENAYFKLVNPDIENNKITLIRLKEGKNPLGYKKGYFVDYDVLFENQNKPIEVIHRSDSSLFLLYFWGKWCHPCLKYMPSTNELGKLANSREKLTMYGVALLSSKEQPTDIIEFTEKEGIVFPNFIEELAPTQNTIRSRLNINAFPTYVLLNSEGKILLRSGSVDEVKQVVDFYLHSASH